MRILLAAAALVAMSTISPAAAPSIESVTPAIGQKGTDFTLKLVGAGLSEVQEAMLYTPGITCIGLKAENDNELSLTLRSATDCSLGTHAFRVRSPRGISELRIFRITPMPVVAAAEPNDAIEQAMPVEKNVTISGVLEKGDRDFFRVRLDRGERLSAEVEAVRLGATLVDTVLTVFDQDGNVLSSVDDTPLFHQDPYLSLIAPYAGEYWIRVQETNLDGDDNSGYALHLGNFPRPAAVFPAGGPVGKRIDVQFLGDGSGAMQRTVQLPAMLPAQFGLFAEDRGMTAPTLIPFRVSPFENVIEKEPNNVVASVAATAADLPVAFNGILSERNDIDLFRFRIQSGQAIQFDAYADRLGSAADTVISILDPEGTVLVSNDDDGSHDSRLVFTAPRTGDYLLRVTDQRGAGADSYFYRVEATAAVPRLTAFLPRPNRLSQERQAIAVPRGNRIVTFLGVQRHGVDSDVQLSPQGLPRGIKNFPVMISRDRFQTPVVIEAEVDAPIGGELVHIQAAGTANGSTVTGGFQQVVDLIHASGDRLYQSVSVDRLAVSVIEAVPFQIELDPPQAELVQDGFIELTVRVIRNAGFREAIDITFPFLPPWVDGPAQITIPANETIGTYVAHAFPQAQPRVWPICAEGRVSTGTARGPVSDDIEMQPDAAPGRKRQMNDIAVSSQLTDLTIAESPVKGHIGAIAAEQGTTLKFDCVIERRGDLPNTMTAVLEGLPNRVNAQPVQVDSGAKSVTFLASLDPTAPVGEFSSLVVKLTGKLNGQTVSFHVGRGGILNIVPQGQLVTDGEGRPLSPLDALRKTQKVGAAGSGGSR